MRQRGQLEPAGCNENGDEQLEGSSEGSGRWEKMVWEGKRKKKKGKEKCLQNRYNKNSTERERLAMIPFQNSIGGIKAVLKEALLLFRWLWKSCTQ